MFHNIFLTENKKMMVIFEKMLDISISCLKNEYAGFILYLWI